MKRALPVFLLSIATYLGVVASNKAPERADTFDTPLDLAQVNLVEVHSPRNVEVHFDAKGNARVTAGNNGRTKIFVNRNGGRLVIQAKVEDADTIKVYLPPGISRLVVGGRADVDVAKSMRLPALVIEARGDLQWSGAAESLEIVAPGNAPGCRKACNCGADVGVRGPVGRLRVVAMHGDVNLFKPETMGSVDVLLAPPSTVSIHDSRDLGRVRVTDLAGQPISAAGTAAPAKTTCTAEQDAAAVLRMSDD